MPILWEQLLNLLIAQERESKNHKHAIGYVNENRKLVFHEFDFHEMERDPNQYLTHTFKESAFIVCVIINGEINYSRFYQYLTHRERYFFNRGFFEFDFLTDSDFRKPETTFILHFPAGI